MNGTERQMRELLLRGREEYGWIAVKAEFEAEGTRVDELLRLVEIAHSADLKLAVKIGGCEAVRDLLEAKQIGVQYIIAPMVETAFALSKFVLAKDKVYQQDEVEDTDFLFNLETIQGYHGREDLVETAAAEGSGVAGIVFGRSDFTASLGNARTSINDDVVTKHILDVAALCRDRGLDLVVGGGVSVDSIPELERIREVHLTRYETRKVIFSAEALSLPRREDAFLDAIQFELLWLRNKRNYYSLILDEDAKRFHELERRWGGLTPPSAKAGA